MCVSVGLELVFHFFLMLIFAGVMWQLCADGNYSVSMTDYWGSCNLKEEYPYGLAFGLTTRHTSGPFVINLEQRK